MRRKIEDQIIHRYELNLLLCSRRHISLLCVVKFSSLCTARFCKHCCPPEHDICFSDRNLCFATLPSLWNTSDGVSCVSHCFSCKPFLLVHDVMWNLFDVSLTAETNGRVATLACYSSFLKLILTSQHEMHHAKAIAMTSFIRRSDSSWTQGKQKLRGMPLLPLQTGW